LSLTVVDEDDYAAVGEASILCVVARTVRVVTETSMGTALMVLTDTVRRVQDGVKRDGIAGGFEAAQAAYDNASSSQRQAGGAASGLDLNKWLIIIAAVFGAFMVWRFTRKLGHLAIAVFWVWFATHGFRFGHW
jgi:hypothetical protein